MNELYPFQEEGIIFLKNNKRAVLGHEPGLGKTRMALESVRDNDALRVLILCPASIKQNWLNEIGKWLGNYASARSRIMGGTKSEREWQWQQVYKQHWAESHFRFVIMNYELILKDYSIMPKEWDVIIADEATRLANHKTKTWKILFSNFTSDRFIALTGTPIINSPLDLFGLLNIMTKGRIFPNYFKFLNRYTIQEQKTFGSKSFRKIVGYQNLGELKGIVGPYLLRRLKSEVLRELPARTVQDIVFPLSGAEMKQYEAVRKGIVAELGEGIGENIGVAVVKMLRLRQVCDDVRLVGVLGVESSKLAALRDILEPIVASGEKAIVFSQFSQMIDLLYHDLLYADKRNAYRIAGDTPSEDRQKIIDEFNTVDGGAVLCMTEAGAFGLNIQGASYIIMYDLPFSVAKYEQRVGRAHRIGQEKNVMVYNLLADVAVERQTKAILDRKYKVSNALLGDSDRLEEAGLTAEDIRSLLNI